MGGLKNASGRTRDLPEVDYPGVYIEEIPSAPRPIEGVSTSTAAFVGYTPEGPVNEARRVRNILEFKSEFGSISPCSDVSYAVAHFFENGGAEAWVVRVVGGADAVAPSPAELTGTGDEKTGIHALDDVDLFNLLLVPGQSDAPLQAAMIAYAEGRRVFVILDLPADLNLLSEAETWLAANEQLRRANAAAYFPRICIADAAGGGQVRSFPNSGAIAGVYARTDRQRGVWKAPAGIDAELTGAVGLEGIVAADQQDRLNSQGLNVLRSFPDHETVVWGSRTLAGADALASEWKYVPVRRTALFIEESLYRGLQWAALEPNAEPLWARIRLSVGAFMHGLFQQGAFQGSTPRESYAIKCDGETTTQADVDAGVINVAVGFAPLKPAEFVWLRFHVEGSS